MSLLLLLLVLFPRPCCCTRYAGTDASFPLPIPVCRTTPEPRIPLALPSPLLLLFSTCTREGVTLGTPRLLLCVVLLPGAWRVGDALLTSRGRLLCARAASMSSASTLLLPPRGGVVGAVAVPASAATASTAAAAAHAGIVAALPLPIPVRCRPLVTAGATCLVAIGIVVLGRRSCCRRSCCRWLGLLLDHRSRSVSVPSASSSSAVSESSPPLA